MKKNILVVIFAVQLFSGLSQSTFFYSDSINFEEPCNYLFIDSSSTNLWQIGIPGKTILDTAYSTPYAIITDTLNYYTSNNHSNFILKLEPESIENGGQTNISFWHRFDTDSINDYGVVEVSYDEGTDWKVLCTDTTYHIYYTRNGFYTGSFLATGISNSWMLDHIEFDFYLTGTGFPENIWLRFSFYSDDVQNEKEGWMIDNIQITGHFPWGIEENNVFNSYPYPNPCQKYLYIVIPGYKNLNFTLYIYDYLGKIIESERFAGEKIQINTVQYKNGIYFYKIISKDDRGISHGKFIIKK